MYDSLQGRLPLERLQAAGHWAHLEQPDRFRRLLLDWLAEDRTTPAAPLRTVV